MKNILGMLEACQPYLGQRVDADNGRSPTCGTLQSGKHPRMVCTRILPNNEDGVSQVEVFQFNRALANPYDFPECQARRLMAQVGAVGQIIRPELPHKQLIEECGFITGSARRVEDRLIGTAECVEFASDQRESIVP